LAVISEGLGHTNQRTTEIYLASLARSIIDHASRVVSEAIKPGEKTMKIKKRDRLFLGGGVGLPSGYGMFGGGYGYAVGYR
jgi:hypothetical protein